MIYQQYKIANKFQICKRTHMAIVFFKIQTIQRAPTMRKEEREKSDKIFLKKHCNVYACKISPVADFFHIVGI